MNNSNQTNRLYSNSSSFRNSRVQPNSFNNNSFNYNSSSTNYYQRRYNSMKGISKKSDISSLDGASYLFVFISFFSLILWNMLSPFNVVETINIKLWSLTFLACFLEFGCFVLFIINYFSESLDIQNGNHYIIIFLFFLSFLFSSNLIIRIINAFDIHSKTITTTEYILNRKETGYVTKDRKGREHEHRSYYLILGDKDKVSQQKMISVDRDIYYKAERGDHWVTNYKPGLLGIKRYSSRPYIVHNHLYEKVWDERMREAREKAREAREKRENNKYR